MLIFENKLLLLFYLETDGAQGAGDVVVTTVTPEDASTMPPEPNMLEKEFYKVKEQLITGKSGSFTYSSSLFGTNE